MPAVVVFMNQHCGRRVLTSIRISPDSDPDLHPDGIRVSPRRRLLAEVTPVRGDDEKYTRERKRDTCDDRPGGGKPEFRDLRRGKPDPGEQDEQEADFRKAPTSVMRQSDDVHVRHSCCAVQLCPDAAALPPYFGRVW